MTDSTGAASVNIRSRAAGTGTLTATMENGNSRATPVSFVAAAPVQASSAIAVDNTTHVSGSRIKATVTLKYVGNNPVSGKVALLTTEAVTVSNATATGSWTDNGDGTYGRV